MDVNMAKLSLSSLPNFNINERANLTDKIINTKQRSVN